MFEGGVFGLVVGVIAFAGVHLGLWRFLEVACDCSEHLGHKFGAFRCRKGSSAVSVGVEVMVLVSGSGGR